jgi:hypothetical protein
MKRIKTLIILLIIANGIAFSQQKSDDLQKVKDALVNMVLYTQELEKQNANLTNTVNKIAKDLGNINTIEQLDSLKIAYGIKKNKLNTKTDDSKNIKR